MAQALRRFIPRAPRYVLRTQDEQLLRFAHMDERSRTVTTQFLNMSMTGLAFSISRNAAPLMGEVIKVEFPVPGGEHVAWWGRVVRIEESREQLWWHPPEEEETRDNLVIGIEFHELPDGHRNLIQKSLDHKFREISEERRRLMAARLYELFAHYFWRTVLILGSAICAFAVLYYLSLPDSNYDPERGAPWGQRYEWLNNLFGK